MREHANPDLLRRIESFESTVETFCKRTYIADFIDNFKNAGWKAPTNFAELRAKFNINPKEYTLHQLQEFGRELWTKCKLKARLFDVCSMIFHKVEPGSVYGTWRIPRKLVPVLTEVLKRGEFNDFLVESKFLKISIDFQVVYSYEGKYWCIVVNV